MARKPTRKDNDIDPTDVVTVIGPKNGRRRADRRFGTEPVLIPVADLSEAELDALMGDEALIVSIGKASEEKS